MKRIICVILAAFFVMSLAGCQNADAHVYFEMIEPPENLDPQTAYTDSDLIVVRNIFEGLLRKDQNGKIVKGACSDYKKEGNVYTFTLRDGLKWSNNTDVKAEDFVFGMKRAVDPSTAAPFASRLFAVENARQINKGNADLNTLGVHADGNKVIITLCEEDADFEDTLTSSVCMPCSSDFFYKTEGKYGQELSGVISNGSYRLAKWNREEFGIRLYKNEKYNGGFEAKNGAVFFSCNDKKTKTERLDGNACDMTFLPSDELSKLDKKFTNVSVQNTCWVLTIGTEYSKAVRKAFMQSFSPETYKEFLPEGYAPAYSVYPAILSVEGAENEGITPYDLSSAQASFSSIIAKTKDKNFESSKLYYFDKPEIKEAVTSAVGHWQQNLCAFINIVPSNSLSALQKELGDRTLQFSLFPVTARSGAVKSYLELFGKSGDAITAQRELFEDYTMVPFAFESTNITYSGALKNVCVDIGNGYVDFSFVEKTE